MESPALLLARWGQALLPAPVGTSAPADWRIVAFTAGMTVLAGIVFGIAPALRATKMDVGSALKETSRSVAASNTMLSRALLVVQVSISVVLLVGAGLFLHARTICAASTWASIRRTWCSSASTPRAAG